MYITSGKISIETVSKWIQYIIKYNLDYIYLAPHSYALRSGAGGGVGGVGGGGS